MDWCTLWTCIRECSNMRSLMTTTSDSFLTLWTTCIHDFNWLGKSLVQSPHEKVCESALLVASDAKLGLKGGSVSKTIYFSPIATMGYIEWEIFLKSEFAKHPKKLLVNILSDLLWRFVEGFIAEFFPNIADTFPVSISKVDRENISKLLGNGIVITLIERRPWDEFVTAGGVNTDEIDGERWHLEFRKTSTSQESFQCRWFYWMILSPNLLGKWICRWERYIKKTCINNRFLKCIQHINSHLCLNIVL